MKFNMKLNIAAMAVIGGLCLCRPATVIAGPMLCSGEYKTCVTACATLTDRTVASACASNCHARQSMCMRNGCWPGPTNKYCGLLRQ